MCPLCLHDLFEPRSLSQIRLIYCGCTGFGQIFRSFSLNSPTIRLTRSKYLTQTSTSSRRSLISDRLLETAVESFKFWVGFAFRYSDFECREKGRNTALAMKGLFAVNSSLLTVPWNLSARYTVGKFEPFKIRIFTSERTRQSEGVSPRVFWRWGYPCLCELKG